MIYVTSDLHGCYQEFLKLLEWSGFNEKDQLYIIGDVLDNGKEPIKLLEYIMSKSNMEVLLGNHEMALVWNKFKNTSELDDETLYHFWQEHGGAVTEKQFDRLCDAKKKEILNYLLKCKRYKILDDYVLVHAGAAGREEDFENLEAFMESQDQMDLFWRQSEFYCKESPVKSKKMIFGHTFSLMIRHDRKEAMDSTKIWQDKDRIGLDCGYLYGGKMVLLRLDDEMAFYLNSSGGLSKENAKILKKCK